MAFATAGPPSHCAVSCRSVKFRRPSWDWKPSPGTMKSFSWIAGGNAVGASACRDHRSELQNLTFNITKSKNKQTNTKMKTPSVPRVAEKKVYIGLRSSKIHIDLDRRWIHILSSQSSVRCALVGQCWIGHTKPCNIGRWKVPVLVDFTHV